MEDKVLIFGHTDLDGMGVQIVGIKYAQYHGMNYLRYSCNYHNVDSIIENAVKAHPEAKEILIADISVSHDTAKLLQELYVSGIKVTLRDHHETAMWLNKYAWAKVSEVDNQGVPRCGTWMLSECVPTECKGMEEFIKLVDDWDTWKWKATGGKDSPAKKLNELHAIFGEDWFIEYILNRLKDEDAKLFTKDSELATLVYERAFENHAKACERGMRTIKVELPYKRIKMNAGVVWCNHDISATSDYILTNRPELDFIILINMPNGISFRSAKDLKVPLGDIAKLMTGNGGGHPKAAGSAIAMSRSDKAIKTVMRHLNTSSSVRLKF